jgi:hypothetical protein
MVVYKMVAIEIENKVDEMLECLNVDIEHIQKNLSYLNELRSLVIKRDDTALSKLLENIQQESEVYKNNESKRQNIRKELAHSFNCSIEQMTLSMLETKLADIKRNQVNNKKVQLKTLVEEFKKQYSSTIILISECARFNKMLIKSIFDLGKTGSVFYNASGKAKEHNNTAFVNMQL